MLEARGLNRTASLADLATSTVAALAPPGWDVTICDERVQPVDFDTPAASWASPAGSASAAA